MTMNRSSVVNKLNELYPKLSRKDVDSLVKNMFSTMLDNIAAGERIEIRGFGSFSLKERAPGVIRNPRDGITLQSEGRHVVYFRAGKELKTRVNTLVK